MEENVKCKQNVKSLPGSENNIGNVTSRGDYQKMCSKYSVSYSFSC